MNWNKLKLRELTNRRMLQIKSQMSIWIIIKARIKSMIHLYLNLISKKCLIRLKDLTLKNQTFRVKMNPNSLK